MVRVRRAEPACGSLVAEGRRQVIGTGVASIHGPVGWIGTIWVARSWRGQGLGRRLTEGTIDAAEVAGCRDAPARGDDAGRPLYERLGFEVQTRYRTMEARGRGRRAAARDRVRAFAAGDLDAMLALDARPPARTGDT